MILWSVLFVTAFYTVHLFWTVRRMRGAWFLLPALHLLCGAGLALMMPASLSNRAALPVHGKDFWGGVGVFWAGGGRAPPLSVISPPSGCVPPRSSP